MAGAVPVLVVDDNQGFLRAARAVLEQAFAVHTVENGADAELAAIPVLVMSQADWEEDAAAARAAGARQFRVKPSRVQALREAIVAFWKEHARAGARPADRG